MKERYFYLLYKKNVCNYDIRNSKGTLCNEA